MRTGSGLRWRLSTAYVWSTADQPTSLTNRSVNSRILIFLIRLLTDQKLQHTGVPLGEASFILPQLNDLRYRRLTYMMLDRDIVAVSPATVYRVLSAANLLGHRSTKTQTKGQGFDQPNRPHRDWHVDVAHINICGTFYFMTTVIDGFSRAVVHWEVREKMEEIDIEAILQRAREKHPDEKPRIITDNGPQFVSKDFKSFVRISGMTHVRTSPYYPQSNGKVGRYHRTVKSECIRPKTPLSLEDARRVGAKDRSCSDCRLMVAPFTFGLGQNAKNLPCRMHGPFRQDAASTVTDPTVKTPNPVANSKPRKRIVPLNHYTTTHRPASCSRESTTGATRVGIHSTAASQREFFVATHH